MQYLPDEALRKFPAQGRKETGAGLPYMQKSASCARSERVEGGRLLRKAGAISRIDNYNP
jgi:hypothetical protein